MAASVRAPPADATGDSCGRSMSTAAIDETDLLRHQDLDEVFRRVRGDRRASLRDEGCAGSGLESSRSAHGQMRPYRGRLPHQQ